MKRTTKIILIVAIVLLLMGGVVVVMPVVKNGSIIGDNPAENADEAILVSPLTLLNSANAALVKAGQAKIDLDTYALARALRSEHGSASAVTRTWVGWAIKNNASRAKVSVFDKLTKSKGQYSGKFARQRTDARYAATNQSPRQADIDIARMVMMGTVDPTGGAKNFFSPKAQDALFAKGTPGINRDGDATIKKWVSEGLKPLGAPPGESPRTVQFFA